MKPTPAPVQAVRGEPTLLDSKAPADSLSSLYRAACGPLHATYYARVFAGFEARGRAGMHWNWAAALCTLNWMILRRLWGAALAYAGALVAAALLVFGIGRLVWRFPPELDGPLLLALVLLACVLPGLWGNALLYRATGQRIVQALASHHTLAEAQALLLQQAPGRQRWWFLLLANAALAAALLALWSRLPLPDSLPWHSAPMRQARQLASGPATDLSQRPAAAMPATVVPATGVPAASVADTAVPDTSAQASPAATQPEPSPAVPSDMDKPSRASPARPAANAGRIFLINVGLFAHEDNALRAQALVEATGLPVLSQRLHTTRGARTRIRSGPYATEDSARAAAEKIQAQGLEAVVFESAPLR